MEKKRPRPRIINLYWKRKMRELKKIRIERYDKEMKLLNRRTEIWHH